MTQEEEEILAEQDGIILPKKGQPYIEFYGKKLEKEVLTSVKISMKMDLREIRRTLDNMGEEEVGYSSIERAYKMKRDFLAVIAEVLGEMDAMIKEYHP